MQVDSGGVGIHVDIHGPDGGVPVLLLHGWPDTGRLWSRQIRRILLEHSTAP